MEKRLIDANSLMDEFRRYMAEKYDRNKCVSEENCEACQRGCLWRKIVNNAPTVEARHGSWAFVGDACVCSACHKASIVDYYFCPECGAKMDGE